MENIMEVITETITILSSEERKSSIRLTIKVWFYENNKFLHVPPFHKINKDSDYIYFRFRKINMEAGTVHEVKYNMLYRTYDYVY